MMPPHSESKTLCFRQLPLAMLCMKTRKPLAQAICNNEKKLPIHINCSGKMGG